MRIDPLEDGNIKSPQVKGKKLSKSKLSTRASQETGFLDVLEKVEEDTYNQLLEKAIKDVVEAGNELVRSPTHENFKKYRESVKHFLKLVEKKLYRIEKTVSVDLHVVANQVDEKLNEIASTLLQLESGAIKLAAKVEEIYGLLINIYR
ncbi:YaaR family protein [Thermotoga caldifontis]|uniref:YaaR family protein n=1 Tax=Thermotoga caldifontis TaxID=1508419 RepID=UPI00059748B4|nr:YaaR family protein [Thermotoga caldifontis]